MLKLQLDPRPEEVPVSEAQVATAEFNLRQAQDRLARAEKLLETPGAIARQDYVAEQQAVEHFPSSSSTWWDRDPAPRTSSR